MKIITKGSKKERELFDEVYRHYLMALEDLESRFKDWDGKYELFRSYIKESNWPYSSLIFVPYTFTALFEKMARLNGGKPRGRLIPREGGDVIGAKIHNELLNYQWDDMTRVDKETMIAKLARMDLNARIYGASFGLVKWHYQTDSDTGEVIFDGNYFKPLNPKDCLPNPSYNTVKNWFQYRDYLTIAEMESVNDVSQEKPRYKNLKLLRDSVVNQSKQSGDHRDINYTPRSKEIMGLTDYLGKDESPDFKTIEIVTELRGNRKIAFAPRHGVIVQDEPNPYKHKQIPIVTLKYIPIDDDIYGLSEIEPVEKVQKAINALSSQFVDTANMDLYRIMMVNPTNVQMHTLEWGPGKKWSMNNPGQDVVPLEISSSVSNNFVNVYTVLTQMFKEAMGEASASYSSLKPFGSEKTATEISETTTTRNVRDNFNQIFLSETIKEIYSLWLSMNKQFIFANPEKEEFALRVVGRDSLQDFQQLGLGGVTPDTSEMSLLSAEESIVRGGVGDVPLVPNFPVSVGGQIKPKFEMDPTGDLGTIHVTPDDMVGNYDFVIDVEPMRVNSSIDEKKAKMDMLAMLKDPAILQSLAREGKAPKMSEILISVFESSGIKGGDKYFETLQPAMAPNGTTTNPAGIGESQGGGSPGGNGQAGGMVNPEEVVGTQGNPLMG